MALKGNRYLAVTEISFFMDQVAEQGGVVTLKTGGSGAALDQQEAEVEYAASPSGKYAVGFLLANMVNKDLTQTHLNFQKPSETQKGSKVPLARVGWLVTNMIEPGVTPTAGAAAYCGLSGLLTTSATGPGGYANPEVGRFESTKDENSYAKVAFNLPK